MYLRAHVQLSEVNLLKLFGSHSRPVALARKCHCLDYLLITLHLHIITNMFSEWLLNGTNRYTAKENVSINETFQWNIRANMERFVGATLFISQFKFPLREVNFHRCTAVRKPIALDTKLSSSCINDVTRSGFPFHELRTLHIRHSDFRQVWLYFNCSEIFANHSIGSFSTIKIYQNFLV